MVRIPSLLKYIGNKTGSAQETIEKFFSLGGSMLKRFQLKNKTATEHIVKDRLLTNYHIHSRQFSNTSLTRRRRTRACQRVYLENPQGILVNS